jgi:hypothetical protein
MDHLTYLILVRRRTAYSDELDLQFIARVPVQLQFQVQVQYRVADLAQVHTLNLPNTFVVDFSNATDWNQYRVGDSGFVPA